MDRRVQRTRESLHRALIALMIEKGYDAVTVGDIVDRANVGRSTFYAHYTDKEDLFDSGFKNFSKQLLGYQRAALATRGSFRERGFAFSLPFFEYVDGHRRVYHAIVGRRTGEVAMRKLRNLLAELVRNDLARLALGEGPAGIPRNAVVQFVVGALMGVVTWWLDEKSSLTPAQADAIFRRMAVPVILDAAQP